MLNPDLEIEHGWAIAAVRDAFGRGSTEVVHGRRGRSLRVRVRDRELVLYEADTKGGVPYSLNKQRDRLGIVQNWINGG